MLYLTRTRRTPLVALILAMLTVTISFAGWRAQARWSGASNAGNRPAVAMAKNAAAPPMMAVNSTIYAVSASNQLITFDSATPGTIATSINITGLDANTTVRGIDFRPATGQLYALGIVDNGATQTGRLYLLNTANAVATPVGPAFSSSLGNAFQWEIDFNPTVDLIRVVNSLNSNLRLNPNDGSLVAADTDINPGSTRGIAYDRNEGASLTTLYAYDFNGDRLATIGGINGSPSPNGGTLNAFPSSSGIVAFGPTPFDIGSGSTTGFLTTVLSLTTNLVSMNLSTGAATNLGLIGNGTIVITGLAVPLQSLTVVGTSGPDTLVVNATGPNSGSYSLNGGPAVPFSNLDSFSFIASGGNDTLTINNPAGGLFAPTSGIDYNGGGQAGDSLRLVGGGSVAFSQSYFVGTTNPPIGSAGGNNGDGLLRFTGPTPVDIRFTGLAPITDSVAVGSFSIVATDAANTISVTNGGGSRLLLAVDAFETIEVENKSLINVIAGDGIPGNDAGDTINVNYTNTPAALTTFSINSHEGNDTITLSSFPPAAITMNVNGGPHSTGDTLSVDGGGAFITNNGTLLGKNGAGSVSYTQIENLSLPNATQVTETGGMITLTTDPAANHAGAANELIAAINLANSDPAPTTIKLFDCGTYSYNTPHNWEYGPNALPQISSDITIEGFGAIIQRAAGAPKLRLFYVSGGLSYNSATQAGLPAGSLTLRNLTLSNGLAKGGNSTYGGGGMGAGGAIFNQGTLALDRVTLNGNKVEGGDSGVVGLGAGGGGIGGDALGTANGGGFGGPFAGVGGMGVTTGGGGFRPVDNASGTAGGGNGKLGANTNGNGDGGGDSSSVGGGGVGGGGGGGLAGGGFGGGGGLTGGGGFGGGGGISNASALSGVGGFGGFGGVSSFGIDGLSGVGGGGNYGQGGTSNFTFSSVNAGGGGGAGLGGALFNHLY